MKKLFSLAIILFFLFLLIYLTIAFNVSKAALKSNEKASDAILVLGARAMINNNYNPCLLSRMQHAVILYKEKFAKKIIVSGGTDKEDKVNEAFIMKKIAMNLGVPSKDIIIEPRSTSTYENLVFTKKILKDNKLETVIIVTEPFHSLRASMVAKKQGFIYRSSPAKTSLCWKNGSYFTRFFLKEPLAIMVYKLQNKL